MAKNNSKKVIYYHEVSEKIFREKGVTIAGIVNSIKPFLQKLGFLDNINFTSLVLDLLDGNYSKIDSNISDKIKLSSGGIEYVERQLNREFAESKRKVLDLIDNIKIKLQQAKPSVNYGTYTNHTLDNDECLHPKFLSIDEVNDIFVLDEDAVNRVKDRFEISLSAENLKLYEDLEHAVKSLNSVMSRGAAVGFDPFYLNPMDFIQCDDSNNNKVFSVDIIELWESMKMLDK